MALHQPEILPLNSLHGTFLVRQKVAAFVHLMRLALNSRGDNHAARSALQSNYFYSRGYSHLLLHGIFRRFRPSISLPAQIGILGDLAGARLSLAARQLRSAGISAWPVQIASLPGAIHEEGAQVFLADYSLLALAQEYLQCGPCLAEVRVGENQSEASAGEFRYDSRFLKAVQFLLILPATAEGVKFSYVRGSHRPGKLSRALLRPDQSLVNADEVSSYFQSSDIITLSLKVPTCLALDPKLLHRFDNVNEDRYSCFQFSFSASSPWWTAVKTPIQPARHSQFEWLLKNRPQIYSAIFANSEGKTCTR